MASGEDRRAQLMAKARRGQNLSASEMRELTSGQLAKLRSEGRLNSTAGQWVDPGNPFGVGTPGGPPPLPEGTGDLMASLAGMAPPPPPPPKFENGYTPDSVYDSTISSLVAARKQALDNAMAGEKTYAKEYGLGINQDDNGATFNNQWAASDASRGGIDPSNPFSRASLLNKSYFTAGKVGEGAYANRGLLTSGAYQRNQGRDTFRFESGKDSLLKQFAKGLQDYRQQRSNAQSNYTTGELSAKDALYGRRVNEYNANLAAYSAQYG